MEEITGHIRENISINKQTILFGMITGDVVIENDSTFIIHGMINGNIIIANNSAVLNHGIINGDIVNSGLCKIFGTVNGKLINRGGEFDLDPNS